MQGFDHESREALKGKVALVTGGASGIGRAAALLFAREGAAVAVVDLNEHEGAAVVQTIVNAGGRGIFVQGDVTRTEDCQSAVQQTVKQLGKLDILFNNAGIIRRASVVETSEREWDLVMATNVKSVFLLSKYTIPVMAEAGGGVIVNTASNWGLVGGQNAASYCASKGAVVLLTKAMAIDHAVQNIRVNCICPGDTNTAMLRSEAQQLDKPWSQFLAESARSHLLQRVADPEEIAQAALYLASDASSFVTGTALVVDGGAVAGS
jgi:NAD(P)-dependent dehydrogenase (short-subunit alcohol dehydrogenase family)